MRRTRSLAKILFLCGITFLGITAGPNFIYLYKEFILTTNDYRTYTRVHKPLDFGSYEIPKVVHQVMFNSTIPKAFLDAQDRCKRVNHGLKFVMWNKTMVDDLVEKQYPFLRELFHGYDHWVKRADAARYLIIHHYGGIYIDMDTYCRASFEKLWHQETSISGKVIVRTTTPWGFSNDFFAAPRFHPFLWEVITSLHRSNRWFIFPYATIVFSTGPSFFWGRYLNYKRPEEFVVIENYTDYIESMHWSSWHQWDGHIVWFTTHNLFLFFVLIALFLLLGFYLSKRSFRQTLWRLRSSVAGYLVEIAFKGR